MAVLLASQDVALSLLKTAFNGTLSNFSTVIAQLQCCLRVGGGRGQGGLEKAKQAPATDGDFVKWAHALIPFTFKLLSLAKGQPPYSASFRKPNFPVS